MNDINSLFAISPIDGRYRKITAPLADYFSEFALIGYRFKVEAYYFIALLEILPQLQHFKNHPNVNILRKRTQNFSPNDAKRVKIIEEKINHDVKSVEDFMRELLFDFPEEREFLHFALTSFDTDGMARPWLLKDAHYNVVMPLFNKAIDSMRQLQNWNFPMLARTHGQPASPTIFGKEMKVFVERIDVQRIPLDAIPWSAKFGGATGNFNAHHVAYPEIDWRQFADKFVSSLGHTSAQASILPDLVRTQTTTQIEHYDNFAAYCQAWIRINNILINFARDIWNYTMLEYIKQKPKSGEVGSSTMPHKINPIDFENAEGNLGLANAILDHFVNKLPISRLQRDLTDSTVIRNVGVPLAHMMVAFHSLAKGIGKLEVNEQKINEDLGNNWAVIAEAIQTILRRERFPNSYDTLKELTRTGEKITKKTLHKFINSLDIDKSVKTELMAITPWNYTGITV